MEQSRDKSNGMEAKIPSHIHLPSALDRPCGEDSRTEGQVISGDQPRIQTNPADVICDECEAANELGQPLPSAQAVWLRVPDCLDLLPPSLHILIGRTGNLIAQKDSRRSYTRLRASISLSITLKELFRETIVPRLFANLNVS